MTQPQQFPYFLTLDENDAVNCSKKFFNYLDLPGISSHNLHIRIGSQVILLRNLNSLKLCIGTLLIINRITGNVLAATFLTGNFKGEFFFVATYFNDTVRLFNTVQKNSISYSIVFCNDYK